MKQETRRTTQQLLCESEDGTEHALEREVEEVRVWLAHGHWGDWGVKTEWLTLNSQAVIRLSPTTFQTENPPQKLTLVDPPEQTAP